MEWNRGAKG